MKFIYKNLILIFLFIFVIFSLYSQINEYEIELVKAIPIGTGKGELAWPKNFPYTPIIPIFISPDGYIYIPNAKEDENVKEDLHIYTLDLNYVKSIDKDYSPHISFAIWLKINEYNEIFYMTPLYGLTKLDVKGNKDYTIKSSILNDRAGNQDLIFLYGRKVIYYKGGDREIVFIDENGKKMDTTEELLNLFSHLKEYFVNGIKTTNSQQGQIISFLKAKKRVLINNRLITPKIQDQRAFYNLLKKMRFSGLKDNYKLTIGRKDSYNFIGFDNENNNYWFRYIAGDINDYVVVILTQYGEFLDILKAYRQPHARMTTMAVAPNGDIYFKDSDRVDNKFHIYRIRRQWALEDSQSTKELTTSYTLKSLTASTYIDYNSIYTPSKVFDNKPETGWIEASEGPGKGDYIKLEFANNITIDAIEVMPGYFDKKWWGVNNRVKQLKVFMDDTFETLNFEDIMEPQMIKLKEPVTFRKIEFIIRDVYLSGKDNDTAIAEIGLYYQGEKLELDISGIE